MTVKAKIKAIKNGVQVGDKVPFKQAYGNNGRYFEELLGKNGHTLSNDKGVDLPGMGVEVKSRKNGATSYQTMATLNSDDILNLPYEQTHLYDKMQTQYRVKYDDGEKVTDADLYDFTSHHIQDKVEEAYNICREKFINGDRSDWIAGNAYGNLERQGPNTWQYRISPGGMKRIESISKSTFTKLFD
jgi:hypothetical protein